MHSHRHQHHFHHLQVIIDNNNNNNNNDNSSNKNNDHNYVDHDDEDDYAQLPSSNVNAPPPHLSPLSTRADSLFILSPKIKVKMEVASKYLTLKLFDP